jgi:hypothetical protein
MAGKLTPGPSRSVTRPLTKAGAAAQTAADDTTKIAAMTAHQERRIEASPEESQNRS